MKQSPSIFPSRPMNTPSAVPKSESSYLKTRPVFCHLNAPSSNGLASSPTSTSSSQPQSYLTLAAVAKLAQRRWPLASFLQQRRSAGLGSGASLPPR
jgi:hypothetical protein